MSALRKALAQKFAELKPHYRKVDPSMTKNKFVDTWMKAPRRERNQLLGASKFAEDDEDTGDDDKPMSRDEIIQKLSRLGFSPDVLEGMSDEALAEIMRVSGRGSVDDDPDNYPTDGGVDPDIKAAERGKKRGGIDRNYHPMGGGRQGRAFTEKQIQAETGKLRKFAERHSREFALAGMSPETLILANLPRIRQGMTAAEILAGN